MVDFKQALIKKRMKNKLFTDVFCPKKVKDFVLPERISNQFEDGMSSHCLFYGSHGIGKSSLAKALMRDHPHLYINASEEGRIDVLRGTITDFCAEVQLNEEGKKADIKIVLLDEIDGVSQQFFDALKGFMDQFGKKVRFIATSNYINKVPAPIQSRFDCINFNIQSSEEEKQLKSKYEGRLKGIMGKVLKMQISDEAMKFLVNQNFPDFRGALQTIQRLHRSGVKQISVEDVKKKSYEFRQLYDLILDGGKPEDIHTMLMGDYANKVTEVMEALDEGFISYIKSSRKDFSYMIPHISIQVCDHQSKLHQVIDPAITMKSCIYKLMGITFNHKQKQKPDSKKE